MNNANGPQTFVWTDAQNNVVGNSASASFSPAATSWYYIEASDECYTLNDSVKVTIGQVDVTAINITDITSCVGINDDGQIEIITNPPTGNYTFTISGGTQGQNMNNGTGLFTGLYNGTFQINIVDNVTGCTLDTTAFVSSIAGTPPSVVSTTIDHVSCGGAQDGCIELVGINGTTGNLPFDITWTPTSGSPIVENGVISGTLPQNHQLCNLYGSNWSVDIVDQIGCAFNILVTVNEPDPISLGLTTSEPICYGQSNGSVYINATGGTTPYTFEIFDTDSTQLNQNNSNGAELLPSGWYYCQLTDDNGCFENDSIFLNQPDSLWGTIISGDPLCAGDASGWAQVTNIQGAQGYVNFDWQPAPGEIAQDSAFIMAAGNYTVTMVDSAGCVWQEQFALTDPPALVIQTISAEDSYCRGNGIYPGSGTVSGTASGGTGTIVYQWVGPDGLGTNTNTWGNRYPGWYTLCAQDANGCVICDSVYVDSLNPVADFTVDPTSGTEPVTVTITDNSQHRVTNTWSFYSSTDSVSNSIIIGYDSLQAPFDTTFMSDDYTICLVVANDFECYDTLCQSIEIYPEPGLEVPNVVTPNGDGMNDEWSPISEGMAEMTCTILNRWGNKVYTLSSPTDKWDGTNEKTGNPVSDGVYTYVFKARALNGEEFEGQGFIHVISEK